MSTLAQTVDKSLVELEKLSEAGGISPEVERQIISAMDRSRTGRLFGHKSAVDFPKHLLETIATCQNLVEENQAVAEEINEVFSKTFQAKKARRPTVINQALLEIRAAVRQKQNPTQIVIGSRPESKGFIAKLRRRFGG